MFFSRILMLINDSFLEKPVPTYQTSKEEDQLTHLINKFKHSLLCDYTKHIKDICEHLKTMKTKVNIKQFVKDLNIVQRGTLFSEFRRQQIREDPGTGVHEEDLTRDKTDSLLIEDRIKPISQIYQKLAQIKEKYKDRRYSDHENIEVDMDYPSEEAQKRIEDLGSKIRSLLGQKSTVFM